MTVNIKKTNENVLIPTRGSSGAAGYDLYAYVDNDTIVPAGETVLIGTGVYGSA